MKHSLQRVVKGFNAQTELRSLDVICRREGSEHEPAVNLEDLFREARLLGMCAT